MEIGKGSISSILGDKNVICDIIPVDFVVNSMILTAQKAIKGWSVDILKHLFNPSFLI